MTISCISLSAKLKIVQQICDETNGDYFCILDSNHFKLCLNTFITPKTLTNELNNSFVQMGFPVISITENQSLCCCHDKLINQGYICPRCSSVVCEIPKECPICLLSLVSAPSLARSYHHLFPVKEFEIGSKGECFCCLLTGNLKCDFCEQLYCSDCTLYIHDVLHNCPGCLSI